MSLILISLLVVITVSAFIAVCDPEEEKLKKFMKGVVKLYCCCLFIVILIAIPTVIGFAWIVVTLIE